MDGRFYAYSFADNCNLEKERGEVCLHSRGMRFDDA